MPFSGRQIDKLGDRLRRGRLSPADLTALESYRVSHRPAYDLVVGTVRDELLLVPTGRPGKTTGSIVAKLNRQGTRLSQMQDIAGCRLLVENVPAQDVVVESLLHLFPGPQVVDRRKRPTHGYRAVHVIVTLEHRSVEIQVRTKPQHLWAEISEKLADMYGNEIKYGGGLEPVRGLLRELSDLVANAETERPQNGKFHANLVDILSRILSAVTEMGKTKE